MAELRRKGFKKIFISGLGAFAPLRLNSGHAWRDHYPNPKVLDATSYLLHCAGAQAIWQSHIEPGYRNNCAIRLASELRQLGLSAAETETQLSQWNQRNAIELSADELRRVVHSAYQHRFPYRYSCKDEILRRYCPLPNDPTCRQYVAARAARRRTPA